MAGPRPLSWPCHSGFAPWRSNAAGENRFKGYFRCCIAQRVSLHLPEASTSTCRRCSRRLNFCATLSPALCTGCCCNCSRLCFFPKLTRFLCKIAAFSQKLVQAGKRIAYCPFFQRVLRGRERIRERLLHRLDHVRQPRHDRGPPILCNSRVATNNR